MTEEKSREMTEEKIKKMPEEISEENTQDDELADEELDQVAGGYYPQEYREKKAQKRVYS